MDPDGKERWRLEGYLPRDEFRANLEMGLARVAVMRKDWADAESRFAGVVGHFPNSKFAPDAFYWQGICRYKATNDHHVLTDVGKTVTEKYGDSIAALKSVPWLE